MPSGIMTSLALPLSEEPDAKSSLLENKCVNVDIEAYDCVHKGLTSYVKLKYLEYVFDVPEY